MIYTNAHLLPAYVDPQPAAAIPPTPALGTCEEEYQKWRKHPATNEMPTVAVTWFACWLLHHPQPPEPDECERAFRARYPNRVDEPEEVYEEDLMILRDGWNAAREAKP